MSVCPWIFRTEQSRRSTRTSLTMYTLVTPLPDCWNYSLPIFELASCVLRRQIAPAMVMLTIAQVHLFLRAAASTAAPTTHGIQTRAPKIWATPMEATKRVRQ